MNFAAKKKNVYLCGDNLASLICSLQYMCCRFGKHLPVWNNNCVLFLWTCFSVSNKLLSSENCQCFSQDAVFHVKEICCPHPTRCSQPLIHVPPARITNNSVFHQHVYHLAHLSAFQLDTDQFISLSILPGCCPRQTLLSWLLALPCAVLSQSTEMDHQMKPIFPI